MKKNNYLVPTSKKELLKYINEKGISDLICVSSNDPSNNLVFFGLEIHTKDNKIFSITQELINAPKFGPMRVEDFSTGIDKGDTLLVEYSRGRGDALSIKSHKLL